jgi:selenocysteine lyase/cysteine desulfurase
MPNKKLFRAADLSEYLGSKMADDELIYLDNNATTPLDSAVIEKMLPFSSEPCESEQE